MISYIAIGIVVIVVLVWLVILPAWNRREVKWLSTQRLPWLLQDIQSTLSRGEAPARFVARRESLVLRLKERETDASWSKQRRYLEELVQSTSDLFLVTEMVYRINATLRMLERHNDENLSESYGPYASLQRIKEQLVLHDVPLASLEPEIISLFEQCHAYPEQALAS